MRGETLCNYYENVHRMMALNERKEKVALLYWMLTAPLSILINEHGGTERGTQKSHTAKILKLV